MSKNKNNTTRKFDVGFCSCGRIHLVDWDSIDNAIDKYREKINKALITPHKVMIKFIKTDGIVQ